MARPNKTHFHTDEFDALPVMFQVMDRSARITFVSEFWKQKLGYDDHVIGKSFADLVTHEYRKRVGRLTELPHNAQEWLDGIRIRVRTKKGTAMPVLMSALLQDDGSESIVAIFQDVSELLRIEDTLKHERDRLAAIIDGTEVGTWEWSPQTDGLRVDRQWAKSSGIDFDPQRPICMGDTEALYHPDDFARLRRLMSDLAADKPERLDCELRVRCKAGGWVWVRDRGRVIRWAEDGTPDRVAGVRLDIDAQKQAEMRLRRSEALLQRAGELAGIGAWDLDLETEELVWTDEACRIHGVPRGYKPSLKEAISYYPPEVREKIGKAVEAGRTHGRDWDMELPFVQRDGNRLWVRAIGKPLVENGRTVRLSGSVQDITARRQEIDALKSAHETIALATKHGRIGVWEADTLSGRLTWDDTMFSLFAQEARDRLTMSDWFEVLDPVNAQRLREAMQQALQTDTSFHVDLDCSRDGPARSLRVAAQAHRSLNGHVERLIGVCIDLTREHSISRKLAEQRDLMEVTLASIGDGVITTDLDGRITWINAVAEELTGWKTDEARGQPSSDVFRAVNEVTDKPVPDPILECLQEKKVARLAPDSVLISKHGQRYAIDDTAAPILTSEGWAIGAVLVFHDVTDQRRLMHEWRTRAAFDSLTRLHNRAEFEARLAQELRRTFSERGRTSLCLIDLDGFKAVNDGFGHETGDKVLQAVGALLRESILPQDFVARIGGDEFAVILSGRTPDLVAEWASGICRSVGQLNKTTDIEDGNWSIGASIGIAQFDDGIHSNKEALRAADIACYTAKNSGRNCAITWDRTNSGMRSLFSQANIPSLIEWALENDRFELFYQTIRPMDETARRPMRELLVRIRDDEDALIMPGRFIPTAERIGLAPKIDLHVLEKAIGYLQDGRFGRDCHVSVNLSGGSLHSENFRGELIRQVEDADLAVASRLCFEITETAAIKDIRNTSKFTKELQRRNAIVALDDFGAGASSFNYLREIDTDIIKIDKSYVSELGKSRVSDAVLDAFIRVAKAGDLQTVAEGVERPETLRKLVSAGVTFAQGYYIHEPEPVA